MIDYTGPRIAWLAVVVVSAGAVASLLAAIMIANDVPDWWVGFVVGCVVTTAVFALMGRPE